MISRINGMTLIELLVVLMIIGVLVSGAIKAWDITINQTRFTKTIREMDELCYAIVGNPELIAEGKRVDFGYVGDLGMIPDSLVDLVRAPSGVTSWRGPYIKAKFTEDPYDYLKDAWGNEYIYIKDSLLIRSYTTGNNLTPQTWIHRKIANSQNDLLYNTIIGRVFDIEGNPPGLVQKDSVRVFIIHPYYGNYDTFPPLGQTPDENGSYQLTNIPQGNHKMFCIYNKLAVAETIVKYATVYPGALNVIDFRFTQKF
ncbi:MAG: prepilin-type N-terminal cleavage/methylation domain-containing protein [candidate division WOR-3 bacterium]